MVLKIGKNGESNITDIVHYDPDGISYHYNGESAKELIKGIHEALKGEVDAKNIAEREAKYDMQKEDIKNK